MHYLADFHIHSPFSRATSQGSTLAGLLAWARVKGIHLIGSGDFTHPGWFRHLKEHLVPAEPGLFRLGDEAVPPALAGIKPEAIEVRFLLTAEISCIYKRHGQVRKVHNLLFVPDFPAAERVNARLAAIGNIEADGRPILGLDSRDLLEILLTASTDGFLVPAHIWTPWFSLFGSKSGFDRIEECFGDLTPHIFALETGLSSDPAMNRLVSALDRFTLISNSDCHSPAKLGREVNLFSTGLDYFSLRDALREPSRGGFQGTIEFFPEEGKYHYDGHRQCQVCLDPVASRTVNDLCPVCGRPLTIGVTHRVLELADRTTPHYPAGAPGFESLVPLPEVLGEILDQGPATKKVTELYVSLINRFGAEFTLLRHTPIEELNQVSPLLGEAIRRIRTNEVIRQAGFDGEFGRITVFHQGEIAAIAGQESLFARPKPRKRQPAATAPLPPLPLPRRRDLPPAPPASPNPEQVAAITADARQLLVVAGPGTGKTHTLVERIRHLVTEREVAAESIVAITFTNRAASEIDERLGRLGIDGCFVGTFHRFCLEWLRRDQPGLAVAGAEDRALLLKQLLPGEAKAERQGLSTAIDRYLAELNRNPDRPQPPPAIEPYLAAMAERQLIDLDAVVPAFLARFDHSPAFREALGQRIGHLLVDEFQDVNQAQYDLVRRLAAFATVLAIGDPNQAIYGFRGSDLRFFFRFADNRDLAGTTTVVALTRNYRSGAAILTAASALISHNQSRRETPLLPQVARRGRIDYFLAPTAKAEAEFVVQRLEETLGGVCHFSIDSGRGGEPDAGRSLADIAILYRLNSQAEALIEALHRRGLPIQVVGAVPFFKGEGLAPVYHWLQAAAGLASFADQLLLCRSSGLSAKALTLLEGLPADTRDLFAAAAGLTLPSQARARLTALAASLANLRRDLTQMELPAALGPGLALFGVEKSEPSQRLCELAGLFGRDLRGFAEHLRANAESAIYDERAEAVTLMTLHAAKGLEFPVVFICGLEEGLIPYLPPGRVADIEEERRLLYVGMTRAREELILTAAANRVRHGRSDPSEPSRFLQEIPAAELTIVSRRQPGKRQREERQLSLF